MLCSVFTISSATLLCSTLMTSLSMSVVRNSPGMLTTATSLLLCALISDVISTNSNATVGVVSSLFWDPYLYFWTSVHARPLTVLTRFSLRIISNFIVFSFSFSLVFAIFMGSKVLFVCSWFSYFSTYAYPKKLNLLIPFLSKYCVIA